MWEMYKLQGRLHLKSDQTFKAARHRFERMYMERHPGKNLHVINALTRPKATC